MACLKTMMEVRMSDHKSTHEICQEIEDDMDEFMWGVSDPLQRAKESIVDTDTAMDILVHGGGVEELERTEEYVRDQVNERQKASQ